MQTIKTSVVVALLLAVCYGAFVALNAPDPELPPDILAWVDDLDSQEGLPDMGMDVDVGSMEIVSAPPGSTQGSIEDVVNMPPAFDEQVAGDVPPRVELPELPPLPEGGPDGQLVEGGPQAPTNPAVEVPQPTMNPELGTFPPLDGPKIPARTVSTVKPHGDSGSLIPEEMNDLSKGESTPPGMPIDPEAGWTANEPSVGNPSPPTMKFSVARTQALDLAAKGELKQALEQLSPYFASPELGSAEASDLIDLLDALSREVIYSPRHLLEPAYVAKANDSVASVAQQFHITPELLNAINGLGDSRALVPGTPIKVIRGPFQAKVSLSRQELALFVNGLYAGRFPISLGNDPQPKPGAFEVVARERDRGYYGAGGKAIDGKERTNPYGGYWLNLGDEQCIHGTPEMESAELADAGCMSLAPLDARDVYNILVVGSQVVISP